MTHVIRCSVPLKNEKKCTTRIFSCGAMSVSRTLQDGAVFLEVIADEAAVSMLMDACAAYSPVMTVLEEKDWVNEWAKDFDGIEAAPGIMIVPEGIEYAGDAAMVIRIDPRDAFGAGTHPTTRICCGALSQIITDEKYQPPASSFLDIGTGTGVLAILASLYGVTRADGFDIEKISIERAVHNAGLNNCPQIHFACCGIDEFVVAEPYGIVCANVNSVILETFFEKILSCAAPRGIILLSGIGTQWGQSMEKLFADNFLEVCRKFEYDGWLGYILKK